MTKGELKWAILIDGENINSSHAKKIFTEIKSHGQTIIRRVYVSPKFNKWGLNILTTYKINPVVIFPAARAKNSIDIALVIDAMNIMHEQGNNLDGFCIASSDSDFTILAQQLCKNGFKVIGMGSAKTGDSFINECNTFICLEEETEKASSVILYCYKQLKIKTCNEWVNTAELVEKLREVAPYYDYSKLDPRFLSKTNLFDTETKDKEGKTITFIRERGN